MRSPKLRAFTLTEVLVVIGSLGLLAILAIPALSRSKQRARSAACQSNLRQIGLTMAVYLSENGRYPAEVNPQATRSWLAFGGNWRDVAGIVVCPAIPGGMNAPAYRPNWFGSGGPNRSPNLGLAADRVTGALLESQVKAPSEMLAALDPYIPAFPPKAPQFGPILAIPHGDQVQALLCDGHTEAASPNVFRSEDTGRRRRWNNDHESHDEDW